MGVIRIAMPPKNPYCIGRFAAVNMDTEEELGRAAAGETMTLPADSPIDLDIAVVRIGAPAVGLRFQARPGKNMGCTGGRAASGPAWAWRKPGLPSQYSEKTCSVPPPGIQWKHQTRKGRFP